MSDLEKLEALKQRVRETPLDERLTRARSMIGKMCKLRRPPMMSIPVSHRDEDFFITTTLEDARQALSLSGKDLAQRICDFLNELLEIDRPAIASLIANRVPCNQALADHPTVQVGAQHGGWHVGMLGLLNGLCGTRANQYGFINAVFDGEEGQFEDLVRFEVHTDE